MSIVKSAFKVFAVSWVQIPLGIFSNVLVITSLGAEGRGLVVFSVSIATLLAVIGSIALPASSIYCIRKGIANKQEIFFYFSFIAVFFIAIVFLIYKFYGHVFIESQFYDYFNYIFYICILSMYLNFFQSIYLGSEKVKIFSYIVITNSLIYFLSVLFYLVFLNKGPEYALFSNILAMLSGITIALYFFIKEEFQWKSIYLSLKSFKAFLNYGFRRFPSTIIPIFLNQVPNLFIGSYLSLQALGYYSVATTAFNGLNSIPRSMNTLLFGRASESKENESAIMTSRVSKGLVFVTSFLVIMLSIILSILIPVIFGDDFSAAIIPTIILMSSVIFISSNSALEAFLLSVNKPGYISYVNFMSAIFILISAYFLVDLFGISGMALSLLTGRILTFIFFSAKFRKYRTEKLSLFFSNKEDLKNVYNAILFAVKTGK